MTIHQDFALAVAAFVAAILLALAPAQRLLSAIALVAGGVEVAMAFGLLHLTVAGVPLRLVLGLCLAIPGVVLWVRVSSKATISAATVLTLVGLLQVVASLGRLA